MHRGRRDKLALVRFRRRQSSDVVITQLSSRNAFLEETRFLKQFTSLLSASLSKFRTAAALTALSLLNSFRLARASLYLHCIISTHTKLCIFHIGLRFSPHPHYQSARLIFQFLHFENLHLNHKIVNHNNLQWQQQQQGGLLADSYDLYKTLRLDTVENPNR